MKLVCLSDTHGRHDAIRVPEGDVLLHAGDGTKRGTKAEVEAWNDWLGRLPHPHKIAIAGNHDFLFQEEPALARTLLTNATYLEDSGIEVGGVRFWGSPWQPWFFDWAFNLRRGEEIRVKWDLIPRGTDVLVTHGPPHGIRDQVAGLMNRLASRREHVGCEELLAAVLRVRPKVHVFGHIHEGHGSEERLGIQFVNASNCDREYRPVQPPIVVEL